MTKNKKESNNIFTVIKINYLYEKTKTLCSDHFLLSRLNLRRICALKMISVMYNGVCKYKTLFNI